MSQQQIVAKRSGGKWEFLGGMGFAACVVTFGLSIFGEVTPYTGGVGAVMALPALVVFIYGRCT